MRALDCAPRSLFHCPGYGIPGLFHWRSSRAQLLMKVILRTCDDKEVKVTGAAKSVRKCQQRHVLHRICHVSRFPPCLRPVTSPRVSCHVASHVFCFVSCCSSYKASSYLMSRHVSSCFIFPLAEPTGGIGPVKATCVCWDTKETEMSVPHLRSLLAQLAKHAFVMSSCRSNSV